jgi:hypothetical protein
VEWTEFTLTQTTADGYAASSGPIEGLIHDAIQTHSKEILPIVVWIYDLEDEKGNRALETKVFNDMKIGLAMKRFVCLKANIDSLADARTANKLQKRAPIFYLYDPAAKLFVTMEGKKASSRSRFYSAVERLWKTSFEMKLKDFTKKMTKILDAIDKIEKQKDLLSAKKARAAGKPAKLGALNREERKLKEQEKKVQADEASILESCKRKPEFLPEAK